MTLSIEQARAKVAKGNPPFINDRFDYMRAVGMVEGWDAAVKESASKAKAAYMEATRTADKMSSPYWRGYRNCASGLNEGIESLCPTNRQEKRNEAIDL